MSSTPRNGASSLPVRRFLRRVSRTYLPGLYPECVIVCRAALENALTETYWRKRQPIPQNDEGHTSLFLKLKDARARGWLSNGDHARASNVRRLGNRAAHYDPSVTADTAGRVVKMTMSAIGKLYEA